MPAARRHVLPALGVHLALLVACGSSSRPAAEPPLGNTAPADTGPTAATLAGSYLAPHDIEVTCDGPDGWCPETVDDTMTVRDAGEGRVALEIELIQTNGHTCNFSGTLAPVPPAAGAVAQWQFLDPSEEEGPCTLTLAASADTLTVTSDGCRYYCGARASLDATFPRP
jgi:hypothetical protein